MNATKPTAERLREAFDRSFAELPPAPGGDWEDLLAIRSAGQPYAVRVRDIVGVQAGRAIVPTPSPVAALVGLAGFRGSIAPVYSLGCLLGHGNTGPGRWLLLVAAPSLVALSFEQLEAHVRISRSALSESVPAERAQALRAVHVADALRPVIELTALLAAIAQRMPASLREP